MFSPIININFKDLSEVIPVFSTIIFMVFTYDIAIGITAGFIIYVIMKIFSGKIKNIPKGMWILTLLSIIFFIFSPH